MAIMYFQDPIIAYGSGNLTLSTTQVNIDAEVDQLEATTFGRGGWRTYVGGMKRANIGISGFFGSGTADESATPTEQLPDGLLMDALSTTDVPFTIAPDDAVGTVAYLCKANSMSYSFGGSTTELMTFNASVQSSGDVVRGVTLTDPYTVITSTGNGSAVEDTRTGTIHAALHVFGAAGVTPSMTVKIQSAATSGFSSPSDKITFTAATGATSQYATAATTSHTFYRVSYTVSGTSPHFLALVSFGISN